MSLELKAVLQDFMSGFGFSLLLDRCVFRGYEIRVHGINIRHQLSAQKELKVSININ